MAIINGSSGRIFVDGTYFDAAQQNEAVFRNILRDLKENRDKRPMGDYVPEDLETELSLDRLFEIYSTGPRVRKFTITDFTRPRPDVARICFSDVAPMSGGGAELEYRVAPDDSVEYSRHGMIFRC